MKLVIAVLSLAVGSTFSHAQTPAETRYVYVHENMHAYRPNPSNTQPIVRVRSQVWGYDLQSGTDEEVCIVFIEEVIGGYATITPAPGSFLILDGFDYQSRTEFEDSGDCITSGM